MAVLGAQLVITLVMISVIQKLGPHYSLARWLLCSTGLIRYLYPTNEELRQLANIPKEKSKSKRNSKSQANGKNTGETFHILRSLDIQLETTKVTSGDLMYLKFYTDYQWLTDFAVYAGIVYIITEVYQIWFPLKDEINLSMIWCLLVLIFAIKVLISITIQYFQGEESVGERSTCMVMGFLYLLVSMFVLIISEENLEFGLENAYKSFNASATSFLAKQGLSSTGPASKIVLKFCIALWCALLGSLFTFPGLRIARMHWDLVRHYKDNKLKQTLLNISFALPFVLVILWIKPLARNYFSVKIFSGRTSPIMTDEAFDSARLIFIVLTMCLKVILMPLYLQAYLNIAYTRLENQKKEAGRITNVELQQKIAVIFYYLCAVTLQYMAPIIICLYCCLMYKTLGDYSWYSLFSQSSDQCPVNSTSTSSFETLAQENIKPTASAPFAGEIHYTLENLKSVFTINIYRGLFGFSTWWSCFLYFAATSIGLIYQSFFSVV